MISFDTMVQSMHKDSFMHRNDRYFFHKLGKRYDKELREFLVSNFSKEDSVNPKG